MISRVKSAFCEVARQKSHFYIYTHTIYNIFLYKKEKINLATSQTVHKALAISGLQRARQDARQKVTSHWAKFA